MHRNFFAAIVILAVLFAACSPNDHVDTGLQPSLPPEPPLADLDIPVRAQFIEVRKRVAILLESNRDEPDAASVPEDDLAEALGSLGMLYHAYSYWEPALICYQQAAQLAADDTRWLYYSGLVARRLGDYPLSESAFETLLKLDPGDRYARLQLAINQMEKGDLDLAISGFESVLHSDPDNASALVGRGRAALEQSDWTNASIYLEAASENIKNTEVLQGLGLAYRGLGRIDDARRMFEQASISALAPDVEFSDDPRLQAVLALRRGSQTHDRLAMLALTEGQVDKAEQEYVLALRANPDKLDIRQNYGLLLWRKGDRDAAMQQFDRIFSKRPDYVPAHLLLGFELTVAGDFESAETHIRKAVQTDENNIEAQLMLADFLDHTGRKEEALAHYEAATGLDAHNVKSYVGTALGLAYLGRRDESLAVLDAGLENLPGDATLRQLREQISSMPP